MAASIVAERTFDGLMPVVVILLVLVLFPHTAFLSGATFNTGVVFLVLAAFILLHSFATDKSHLLVNRGLALLPRAIKERLRDRPEVFLAARMYPMCGGRSRLHDVELWLPCVPTRWFDTRCTLPGTHPAVSNHPANLSSAATTPVRAANEIGTAASRCMEHGGLYFLICATGPQVPPELANPLPNHWLPRFASEELVPNLRMWMFDLRGLESLAPLALVFVTALTIFVFLIYSSTVRSPE
jgi:hypothetical protein